MPYLRRDAVEARKMLEVIGVESPDELLSVFPREFVLQEPLRLPKGVSEDELGREFRAMAGSNWDMDEYTCFCGAGAYDHYVPSVVRNIVSRTEFSTCYTPYQPEVSQGTLQAIFEYQSLVCSLTGMEAANASMYDGASASAEAALMARAITGRRRVLVLGTVHPWYRRVIRTYCGGEERGVEVIGASAGVVDPDSIQEALGEEAACVIVQQPNFLGFAEAVSEISRLAHARGSLLVSIVDPVSLAIMKPPGEYDCDIAVGEGQVLGSPAGFGGPLLGIFATRKKYVRLMPGRLVGMTVDGRGRRGYVLTLQTREQHIRREKATSNICTNQGLVALASCVYLTLRGERGLRDVATRCYQASHEAARRISRLRGYRLLSEKDFFKEFAVECPVPPAEVIKAGIERKVLPGVDAGRLDPELKGCLLIAVTERRSKEDIDCLVEILKEAAS